MEEYIVAERRYGAALARYYRLRLMRMIVFCIACITTLVLGILTACHVLTGRDKDAWQYSAIVVIFSEPFFGGPQPPRAPARPSHLAIPAVQI